MLTQPFWRLFLEDVMYQQSLGQLLLHNTMKIVNLYGIYTNTCVCAYKLAYEPFLKCELKKNKFDSCRLLCVPTHMRMYLCGYLNKYLNKKKRIHTLQHFWIFPRSDAPLHETFSRLDVCENILVSLFLFHLCLLFNQTMQISRYIHTHVYNRYVYAHIWRNI